jgi:hypothetical protein
MKRAPESRRKVMASIAIRERFTNPIRMNPTPKLPRPASQRPLAEATVTGAQSAAVKVESVQLWKAYVTTSPSGSTDLFHRNVIVVGTPVCPFVGATSTGTEGGLFPAADSPDPLRVTVTGATLFGIVSVALDAVLAVGVNRTARLHAAVTASV